MAKRGKYYVLVRAQLITARESNDDSWSISEEDETVTPEQSEQATSVAPIVQEDNLRLARTATKNSVSLVALKNKKKQEEREFSAWTLFMTIIGLSKPEKLLLIFGACSAIILGGGQVKKKTILRPP